MSFSFDNKSRTFRKILDEQDQVVATVQKKPQGGYDLFDADMHKVRDLPFSSFKGALNYFIELQKPKDYSGVKKITNSEYQVFQKGKQIALITQGSWWWNVFSLPEIELLAEGYPTFKEAHAALNEILEGRQPLLPSIPVKKAPPENRQS